MLLLTVRKSVKLQKYTAKIIISRTTTTAKNAKDILDDYDERSATRDSCMNALRIFNQRLKGY